MTGIPGFPCMLEKLKFQCNFHNSEDEQIRNTSFPKFGEFYKSTYFSQIYYITIALI